MLLLPEPCWAISSVPLPSSPLDEDILYVYEAALAQAIETDVHLGPTVLSQNAWHEIVWVSQPFPAR